MGCVPYFLSPLEERAVDQIKVFPSQFSEYALVLQATASPEKSK